MNTSIAKRFQIFIKHKKLVTTHPAVDYSPANSNITVPNTGTVQSNTFSMFMRIIRTSGVYTELFAGDALGAIDFRVLVSDLLDTAREGVQDIASSTGTVPGGVEVSVGVSHDGTTTKFYINGAPAGSGAGTASYDFNRTFNLGQESGSGNNFTGKMRDFRMAPAVWSDADFLAIHNDKNMTGAANPASIKAWLKMNEGSGSTVADSTGNGNTGTLVNAIWGTM